MAAERGMTLTEVLIALALSALVIGPVYGVIRTGFAQDEVQVEQTERETQLRVVWSLMSDDIREGAPSNKRAGAMAEELSLEFTDDRGQLQRVFWVLNNGELRRQELDGATSGVLTDQVLLENVKVDGALFRYWASDGSEIVDGTQVASCAVRVTVALVTVSPNGELSSRTFDVAHRLRNSEAEPCSIEVTR